MVGSGDDSSPALAGALSTGASSLAIVGWISRIDVAARMDGMRDVCMTVDGKVLSDGNL
jgi:hypothetical protein